MKHIKKIFLITVILSLILCTLTGCIPNNYTAEEEKAFLQKAKKVALSYLSDRYSGAVIREIQPETTVENAEYVLTEFANGKFVWQKHTYNFVVNAETGEVYTSVYLDEIEERLKEAIFRELGITAEETAVEECNIDYLKSGKNFYSSSFTNIFPEEESVEKLVEKILQDKETYHFTMKLQYKGEDLSMELMERESPFSTLGWVQIYHVAEDHALYVGEYGYAALPSLSREIMVLNFRGTADYTRYQTLEQDGIRVTYNAYERRIEQNEITESVISEEDIVLTMTDEFIQLDCTKDNYSMYLSTKDNNIAKKYCYVFLSCPVITEKKTTKGMWYSFEDGYVYADNVYIAEPYEIRQFYHEGNVIYSSPQKK